MKDISSHVLLYLGIAWLIAANVIWYRTKFMLKAKGYNVGWVSRHLKDMPNLNKAIKAETDPEELKRLLFQRKMMLSIFFSFPLVVYLIFNGAK